MLRGNSIYGCGIHAWVPHLCHISLAGKQSGHILLEPPHSRMHGAGRLTLTIAHHHRQSHIMNSEEEKKSILGWSDRLNEGRESALHGIFVH